MSSLLRSLICKMGRHHRLGRAVEWDGRDYRSVCRFCGAAMVKHGNVRWRAVPRRKDTLLLTYQADDVEPWPDDWSRDGEERGRVIPLLAPPARR